MIRTNNHCAPDCDDQLANISRVGRGIQGDSCHVRVAEGDSESETHIEGWQTDSATGDIKSQWITENINGGQLSYQYNLRPYTNPQTFTITFIYRRPGRKEWSWTTPAIPYIWTLGADGQEDTPPDHVVGSGVATLFIKTMHTDWTERLNYPEGTTREDFNAPQPTEAWASTITFGKGGDVEVPDFDDIAKIIGISKEDIFNILENNSITIDGVDATNLIDYIKKADNNILDHVHKDLGFNDTGHSGIGAFGGYSNVKAYIDAEIESLENKINNLNTKVTNMKNGISNLIYGATVDESGNIVIPAGTKIPTGNMNLYGNESGSAYIKTHDGNKANDVRAK